MTESVGGNSHELVCLHSLAYTIEGLYGSVIIRVIIQTQRSGFRHWDLDWIQAGTAENRTKLYNNGLKRQTLVHSCEIKLFHQPKLIQAPINKTKHWCLIQNNSLWSQSKWLNVNPREPFWFIWIKVPGGTLPWPPVCSAQGWKHKSGAETGDRHFRQQLVLVGKCPPGY